jgi:hypothetical protein
VHTIISVGVVVFIIALLLYNACSVKLLLTFFSHSSLKPFFFFFFLPYILMCKGLYVHRECVRVYLFFLHHYLDNYYSIIIFYTCLPTTFINIVFFRNCARALSYSFTVHAYTVLYKVSRQPLENRV